MILSPKYKAFMRHTLRPDVKAEFLEGTTAAGKTTVGAVAFLLRIANSRSDKASAIAGLNIGIVEKNILQADLGLMDVFGNLLEYKGNGSSENKLPHLKFTTPHGEKTIYILGYADKARWKIALGSQMDGLYIDEVNVADIEFVREAFMRAEFVMTTSNPDAPGLPIYEEFINHSRPLPEYAGDAPEELSTMLNREPKPGWVHWFFDMSHNAGIPEERKRQIIESVPPGTRLYFNKILGLRRKATGLIFNNFDRHRHLLTQEEAKMLLRDQRDRSQKEFFTRFTAGLDTAYSSRSPDTIAMSFLGITNQGRCILLEDRVYNNADLNTPIAPSDTAAQLVAFLTRCRETWGGCKEVFIDSADAGTLIECAKYKRQNGCLYNFVPAWKSLKNVDRIELQLGWFAHDQFLVVDTCRTYITELEVYSWKEDKDLEPEDANDHMIQSVQYAWIPYKQSIGRPEQTPPPRRGGYDEE